MDLGAIATLVAIGLVGGSLAGLVGVGGGVVMLPLLIYVGGVPIKLASGISIVQVMFASLSGFWVHWKHRTIHPSVVAWVAGPGAVGAVAGSLVAAHVAEAVLHVVFLLFLVVALPMLILSDEVTLQEGETAPSPRPVIAVALGAAIGSFAGLLGAGGGFLLVPLLISVLGLPTRMAVATSLGVLAVVSVVAAGGKVVTGQVDAVATALVVAGAMVGAQLGGRLSYKFSPRHLRVILAVVIAATAIRTLLQLGGLR
ncbi:MAG TPA: sulfite exporter TauE/SafE family protein [Chloroflexota bacterium]